MKEPLKSARYPQLSQVNILVETALLRTFRAACIKRNSSMTQEMGRLIGEQMVRWKEPTTFTVEVYAGAPKKKKEGK